MNMDRHAVMLLAYRAALLLVLIWIAVELREIRHAIPGGSFLEIEQIAKDVDKIERRAQEIAESGVRVNREPAPWKPIPLPSLPLQ